MEHENHHKRKASPNALDADDIPDPKLPAINKDEESEEVKGEEAKEEIRYIYVYPHICLNLTKLEYVFKALHTENLVQRVVKLTELKPKIEELASSLGRICEDGFDLRDFASKVDDLFACSCFIEACAIAGEEEFRLIYNMDLYKSEMEAEERRKSLLKDGFLTQVLNGGDYLATTRGVLSVLLAYWCDDAFYRKVHLGIKAVIERLYPDFIRKHEKVDEINVSESVEGSKEKPSADESN